MTTLLERMKARKDKLDGKKTGGASAKKAQSWEEQMEESPVFRPDPKVSRKYNLRVLPYWKDPKHFGDIDHSDPFVEVKTHWAKKGGLEQTHTCIKTWGEECPTCEYATFNWWNDKGDKALARKLFSNDRYYALVYVRGYEHWGPKWMGFSKGVYKELVDEFMSEDFGNKPEIGSFTDLTGQQGADWIVKYTCADDSTKQDPETGKKYPEYNWSFSRYPSPLVGSLEENLALIKTAPALEDFITRPTRKDLEKVIRETFGKDDDPEVSSDESSRGGSDDAFDSFASDVPF
jgi:hypothetical protein